MNDLAEKVRNYGIASKDNWLSSIDEEKARKNNYDPQTRQRS